MQTIKAKEAKRILRNNGYELIRNNKHSIWSNGENKIILPISHSEEINCCLWQRLCKENNLKR